MTAIQEPGGIASPRHRQWSPDPRSESLGPRKGVELAIARRPVFAFYDVFLKGVLREPSDQPRHHQIQNKDVPQIGFVNSFTKANAAEVVPRLRQVR